MPPRRPRPGRPPAKPAPRPADASCEPLAGGCQIGDLFRVLGKAHMLDLLHVLTREERGPKRFVDLQTRLAISPNTLSERLKELVEIGLLTRTAYNEIPPRVDYEATAKAHDLRSVFEALAQWARRHDLKPDTPSQPAAA